MAVRGDRAQHLGAVAFGDMQINAVQVVARFLGRDGEPGAVEQRVQIMHGHLELMRQFARAENGKILGRQAGKRESGAPGLKHQLPAAFLFHHHLRPFGQLAHDVVKGMGGGRRSARFGHVGGHALDDVEIHVRGVERQLAVAGFDLHVGKDGDGIAALYNALHVPKALQQGGPLDCQFHMCRLSPFKITCRYDAFDGMFRLPTDPFAGRSGGNETGAGTLRPGR